MFPEGRRLAGAALFLLLLLVTAPAFATNEDRSNGCGVGWQVTNRVTLFGSSTRQTTNVFLPNTFSMTSGTSGCDLHPLVKRDEPGVTFIVSNYDPLLLEMAMGRGEHVDGLARAMGCDDGVIEAFGGMAQKKFGDIYRDGPIDLYLRIKSEVIANPMLAAGCHV